MRKVMWAPWRMEFIKQAHRKKGGCIFCTLPRKGVGEKTFVLYQGPSVFVLLNLYPYSNGHLLVIPKRHVADFEGLTPEEHVALGKWIARSIQALRKEFKAQGFNVGLNLGRPAGAGIAGHLHYHVVPRWVGDSNFMPIFGEVRMMPEHIQTTYRRLRHYFR